ncbi:MAG: hypothetical protein G01um10148_412 [Parcubacteria group bacterium Gr01-1014_8]|nr:MAG: hypothetical protein G01um10148_412 [Parcubacteria group bacterium Gr01-1014_8]
MADDGTRALVSAIEKIAAELKEIKVQLKYIYELQKTDTGRRF